MRSTVIAFLAIVILVGTLATTCDVRQVEAMEETIYIRADGSIDPITANITSADNITYTFTGTIFDRIVVERSDIVIDGAGHTLQGWGVDAVVGLELRLVTNVTVQNTQITDYVCGIFFNSSSSFCSISRNTIKNNWYGIALSSSFNNSISENNITNNSNYGVASDFSFNNRFYHNNLINNNRHAGGWLSGYANVWDDGYPSGGNYWSNYTGADVYRGPSQNISGSDGIGDVPHLIVANNTDRYPLMGPIGSTTQTGENVTVFPANTNLCLIFENITEGGLTTVKKPEVGPTPPPSVSILQYYFIETTADYAGQITIKIIYNESMGMLTNPMQEGDLHLLQCIMLVGDVDEDFDVDIFDLVRMAGVYGVAKPNPRYDWSCDLDFDDDIDIFDIVRLAGNYGKELEPGTGWVDITAWFDPETNSIFGVTMHLSIFGVTRS